MKSSSRYKRTEGRNMWKVPWGGSKKIGFPTSLPSETVLPKNDRPEGRFTAQRGGGAIVGQPQ